MADHAHVVLEAVRMIQVRIHQAQLGCISFYKVCSPLDHPGEEVALMRCPRKAPQTKCVHVPGRGHGYTYLIKPSLTVNGAMSSDVVRSSTVAERVCRFQRIEGRRKVG